MPQVDIDQAIQNNTQAVENLSGALEMCKKAIAIVGKAPLCDAHQPYNWLQAIKRNLTGEVEQARASLKDLKEKAKQGVDVVGEPDAEQVDVVPVVEESVEAPQA